MKFYCRVTERGLVPLDDWDAEKKAQLKVGSNVCVETKSPRRLAFHRKFFVLLRLAADNMPESIAARTHIYNVETLLEAIKIDLGYYDVVRVDGRDVLKLRSISFADMDEAEFQKFYDSAVKDILDNYLKGTDRNDLLEEVEQYVSNRI